MKKYSRLLSAVVVMGTLRVNCSLQESKRSFLHSVVNEGGDKEKLESFVNFCEDTIFEVLLEFIFFSCHKAVKSVYLKKFRCTCLKAGLQNFKFKMKGRYLMHCFSCILLSMGNS